MQRLPRIDCTLLGCDRQSKTYTIRGTQGEWYYSHDSGEVNKRYHFWRASLLDPNKRVTIDLSYSQVQRKLYESTPVLTPKLDLSKLEAFCNQ